MPGTPQSQRRQKTKRLRGATKKRKSSWGETNPKRRKSSRPLTAKPGSEQNTDNEVTECGDTPVGNKEKKKDRWRALKKQNQRQRSKSDREIESTYFGEEKKNGQSEKRWIFCVTGRGAKGCG